MTSRDPSEAKSWDQLDTLIRWTLQKSVRDVTPVPGLWGRIRERVLQEGSVRWGSWRRGFRLGAEAFVFSLLASASGSRSDLPYSGLVACSTWRGESLCWVDEYGILLRRLAVL